jgi:hypothetical protein
MLASCTDTILVAPLSMPDSKILDEVPLRVMLMIMNMAVTETVTVVMVMLTVNRTWLTVVAKARQVPNCRFIHCLLFPVPTITQAIFIALLIQEYGT